MILVFYNFNLIQHKKYINKNKVNYYKKKLQYN